MRRHFERAVDHHRAGRARDALAGYDGVLRADPAHAPALHLSALLLHAAGRSSEAVIRIERSLAIDDGLADVWSNAALIHGALGRVGDAVRALERALAIEPGLAEAWVNLSSVRLETGDARGAEDAARRAWSIVGSRAAAFNLALALDAQRRPADALAVLERLAAADPTDVAVAGLRVRQLTGLALVDAARTVLDRTLSLVDDAPLRIERARLADERRDPDAALADYAAALRIDPDDETALSELVFLQKRVASWDGLAALQADFRQRVARHAANGTASALTPFSFLSDPSTRLEQRDAAEAWSRRWPVRADEPRTMPQGRLRIGYLSADFHAHATGVLAVGLFERHDRARFEVFAYSTGPDDGSALRHRLVAAFDRFVDVAGWPDERIAAAIRADGIDVLVDLKGHTERAPTGVMALRPAPIAVAWLGYPGTTGASFVDYLIGDAIVTPLVEAADYTETLVLLPHAYQVNDDRRVASPAPPRSALGLPVDAVVHCCFNAAYKMTPDVFDAWARILLAVDRSVLWLLARSDDHVLRDRLRHAAMARGIAADRLVFTEPRAHADYLALYRRADVFLDTWPYNAHTTASDALWSACPVLTFRGETFAGRVAASLLAAVGLPEGIARDRDDYVARAIAWGLDPSVPRDLRRRLERIAPASPLFDTARTTQALERAYESMAEQHRAGSRAAIVVDDPQGRPSGASSETHSVAAAGGSGAS